MRAQWRASARHRLCLSVSLGAEHRRVDHERAPRLRVQRVPEPGELVKGWVVRDGDNRGGHHRRSRRPLGQGSRHGRRPGRCGRLWGGCRLHLARGATTALGWGKQRVDRRSHRLPCLVAGVRLIAHVRGGAAAHVGGQRGRCCVRRPSVLRSRRGDRTVPPIASSAPWHHCGQGWAVGGGRARPALAAWRGRRGLILGGGCGRAAPPWSRCACRRVRRVQQRFDGERFVVARAHRCARFRSG